ncbi:MAG TPA: VTT domain-containing protein [Phycicoccus elongatus]|uniref:DedA family protein n=1 Tax=Phycicoccus TaxID=367298 RepID=UPI002BCF65AF|nr:VTT domain-containing protein [Phycicoccus elongatus]MCB9407038.1 VTT domain-containing protein [Tetrasphaera sp.]HPK13225.1 VTT domain-containing protein [Phycicoccus elongatus]
MIADVLTMLPAALPASLGPSWMDPAWLLERFGTEFFVIALVIVFIECGLLFPILPGDSLLFAVGLFVAGGNLHVSLPVALVGLFVAAIGGNIAGYEIGRAIGPKLRQRDGRIIKRKYFDQTEKFFDKHGNKALVIGRFVPIVRTFVTVVAGIGQMDRKRFFTWSAVGAALWVFGLVLAGYFLGAAFPVLGEQIDKAVIVIVFLSVLPMLFEWWKHRKEAKELAEIREEIVDVVKDELD